MVYYIMEIIRNRELDWLQNLLTSNPSVAILGPRQCGKTTLANQFAKRGGFDSYTLFDCENPKDLSRLETPMLTLEPLSGLIIIDEIQRKPELFTVLRVLIDKYPDKRFIFLGSASRDLVTRSSESLAGRIAHLELSGFSLY